MPAPWAFLSSSPLTLSLWIGNRLVAWTSLFVVWRKLRHAPNRGWRFLKWGVLINAAAGAGFALVLWGLSR